MTNRCQRLLVLAALCLCISGAALGSTVVFVSNPVANGTPIEIGGANGNVLAVSWDQFQDIPFWEIFAFNLSATGTVEPVPVNIQFELRRADLGTEVDPDGAGTTRVGALSNITITPDIGGVYPNLDKVPVFQYSVALDTLLAGRYFLLAAIGTGTQTEALSTRVGTATDPWGVWGDATGVQPPEEYVGTYLTSWRTSGLDTGWVSQADNLAFSVEGVPEPGTLVLVGFALLAAGFTRRLRRN